MRRAVTAIAVVVVFVFGWFMLHSSHSDKAVAVQNVVRKPNTLTLPPNAPQLAYLKIATVEASDIPALEPLHGRITYDGDVTARITAPIAGRVTIIRAQLGDRVSANQVLAEFDAPEFAQAQADARKAHADEHFKKAALQRAQLLIDGGVIAQKDYESAVADYEQAQAEAIRADSRLHNLGVSSAGTFALRSHVSGVVTERNINPGTEIQPDTNAPLFVVSDPSHWWVDIEIPEADLDKVQIGQRVRVQTDADPARDYEARIISIGRVLDPNTRRIQVRCTVDDPNQKLKPEMFVRATPLGGGYTSPRVPNTALITAGLKTFLFVEVNPGEFEKREVTLAFRGRDESYIKTGIADGQRAVIAGALLLNAEMQGD